MLKAASWVLFLLIILYGAVAIVDLRSAQRLDIRAKSDVVNQQRWINLHKGTMRRAATNLAYAFALGISLICILKNRMKMARVIAAVDIGAVLFSFSINWVASFQTGRGAATLAELVLIGVALAYCLIATLFAAPDGETPVET